MKRYGPGELDWVVFNNFWPKEVSEKVKKEVSAKKFLGTHLNEYLKKFLACVFTQKNF